MTFIIMFITLAVERFFDWGQMRRWQWFGLYHHWIGTKIKNCHPYVLLALTVLPITCLVGVIDAFLSEWFYGAAKLIFSLVVLMYCMGPANFWAQAYLCLNYLQNNHSDGLEEKIRGVFGVQASTYSQRGLVNILLVESNRSLFAALFWFIIFGPVGAVLYRTVDLCKSMPSIDLASLRIQQLLDWLPVRLLTFIFALAGHFTAVMLPWKQLWLASPKMNHDMLSACGVAALAIQDPIQPSEEVAAVKNTLLLLDRVFSIAMVLAAVCVLA